MSSNTLPTDALRKRSIAFAEVPAGHTVELYLKAAGDREAAVDLVGTDGVAGRATGARSDTFVRRTIVTDRPVDRLVYAPETTLLSVAYAYDPATVLETGITILNEGPAPTPRALAGYHFRPPFGWMNDPNGFGRFDGKAHLFYQHYPHSLRWHAMHWGHAVSDDFLRWRHLPIFLDPGDEVFALAKGAGGVFSGSAMAVAGEPGFRAFYTDHIDGRQPEMEFQRVVRSLDGITAAPPRTVVNGRPGSLELGDDNRDPYVFAGPDGRLKMLLGSRTAKAGVVLLYETDDLTGETGWRFVDQLHVETSYPKTVAECPSMLPLDGPVDDPETRWLLIVGMLLSRDTETRRRNLTRGIVGRFDGRRFTPEFSQVLDFGTDAYGFQAFVDRDGPVGIAWLSNWTDVVKSEDCPTSMTLPRRIALSGDSLLTPPIDAVRTLRGAPLDAEAFLAGGPTAVPDGTAEICVELAEAGAPFSITLDHPKYALGLRSDERGLAIVFDDGSGRDWPDYLEKGARISSLRLFIDRGSIEVFADGGRFTGTKRIPGLSPVSSVQLAAEPGAIRSAALWRLAL